MLVPPPIRGLGQGGGFQLMVEDRQSLGLAELQKAVNEVIRAGNSQSGLRNLISTFNARSPQLFLDIDRTKVESLNIPLNNVFSTLQTYLGSSFVNLFNKFNQVFQVYVQADAPFRLQPEDIKNLYVRNEQGEMVPLGTLLEVKRHCGLRAGDALQPLPCRANIRRCRSGIQLRTSLEFDGTINQ